MEEITIKLPDGYKTIIDELNDPIFIEAIKSVAKTKLKEKEKRLKEIQSELLQLQKKYQMNYEDFAQQVPDSFEGHEDWMEWRYLIETQQRLSRAVAKLKLLLQK